MRDQPRELGQALVLRAVVDDEQRERLARIGVGRRPQARAARGRHGGLRIRRGQPRGCGITGELDDGLVAERAGRAQRVLRIAEAVPVGLEAVLHPVDLVAPVGELPAVAVAGERRAAARALQLLLQPDRRIPGVGQPEDDAVGVDLRRAGHGDTRSSTMRSRPAGRAPVPASWWCPR